MMHAQKISPRKEHLQREQQRVLESPSLAEKFQKLKSLTVDLGYFSPEGPRKTARLNTPSTSNMRSPCSASAATITSVSVAILI